MIYDIQFSVCIEVGLTPIVENYSLLGLQGAQSIWPPERRPQSHKKIILTKIVIKLEHNIDSCFHMIVLYLLKEKKSRFKRREFSFNIYLVKINSGGPQVF